MSEVSKVTAEMLQREWKPSPIQAKNGSRVYAQRLFKEGVKFEESGDTANALIRYELCRSYCKLRELPYPPFSIKGSPLMMSARDDLPFERKYAVKSYMPKMLRGMAQEKPQKPVDEKLRKHGKCVAAAGMCSRGEYAKAKAYCEQHGLPWPPFPHTKISGEVVTPSVASSVSPQDAASASGKGQVPPSSEPVSKGSPEAKPSALLEPVSDWAGEMETKSEHAAQSAVQHAVPAHGFAREVQTGAIAAPFETGGTASNVIAGESHVAQGEPAKAVGRSGVHETASPAPVRKARVWNFPINQRLVNVKFLDGDQEISPMWKTRQAYRTNEIVEVKLERGTPKITAIYEELRKPV